MKSEINKEDTMFYSVEAFLASANFGHLMVESSKTNDPYNHIGTLALEGKTKTISDMFADKFPLSLEV